MFRQIKKIEIYPMFKYSLLLILSLSVFSQNNNQSAVVKSIEQVINQQKLVGTQAAIWYNGQLILDHSWGIANSALNISLTTEVIFK